MKRLRLYIFIIGMFLFSSLIADDYSLQIQVSPNPASTQSTIMLRISLSGPSQSLPDIPQPDLSRFTILSGPSMSTSIQIINFKMSAIKTVSYEIMAKNPGTFPIGPVQVNVKGKTITSNQVKLVVQKGAVKQQQKEDDIAFLKMEIPEKKVYVNQPIPVVYKLYLRARVRDNGVEAISMPDFKGFWVEQIEQKNQTLPYQEMVGNKRYTVYEIDRKIIFPIKTGEITIAPMTLRLDILKKSQQSRDPFGFFDDFDVFGNYTIQKKVVSSDEITLKVQPLPEHTYTVTPIVGDFSLNVNKTSFRGLTNDAFTLKVIIKGEGYTEGITNLPLKFPPGFEVYDPKISKSSNIQGGQYVTQKTFEYIIIPKLEGAYTINPTVIPVFDFKTKTFKKLVIPELHFQVERNPNQLTVSSTGEVSTLKLKDIRYIKTEAKEWTDKPGVLAEYRIYLVLLALNIVILSVLFQFYRFQLKLHQDISFARVKRAKKVAIKRLAASKKMLNKGAIDSFSEELYHAVTGFISDQFNLENKNLTTEEVRKELEERGINTDLIQKTIDLLNNIETLRFSPVQDKSLAMNELYNRAKDVIITLQNAGRK